MKLSPCTLLMGSMLVAFAVLIILSVWGPRMLAFLKQNRKTSLFLTAATALLLVSGIRSTSIVPCKQDVALQWMRAKVPVIASITRHLPDNVGCKCQTKQE